ncbi:tyrosine-type recombinase/integrase [uncultured Kordia sp.]|uniref:tyrosine-type recombinase/integrase n=1 Tax=uncultured Kordia sp. TaxID=507699 RepID=UPI00260D5A35|nr:tyrosine-type recombinase/integrase [uncultured Kordia sp.]
MRSTFNLKSKKKQGKTLIYLIAHFKNEGKKFVYSTGESINPKDWDFENRQPKDLTGRTEFANTQRSIKMQLDRYANFFIKITDLYRNTGQELTIENIRSEFNKEFKRTKTAGNDFFTVYDLFLNEKKNDKTDTGNSTSTIKRYEYNKKLLESFEEYRTKKLHFSKIDKKLYNEFISYCITEKKHSTNTLSRNIGLFKTFMYWAFDNNYTYKSDFKEFKNIKKEITDEVALTMEQVTEIINHDFSKNPRLERVRDLFVFGCVTGMRYSNYSKVKENDISNGFINVRDQKNNSKVLSIPLNDYSKFILKKYDYKLPKITNQKFNDYVKEVIEKVGYTEDVKKTYKIGKEVIETISPFYERVSSHTARRSFITIMKNKKIPDKVIMSYIGHKSLEVFNQYYKPNNDEKIDFMQTVWKMESTPLKKVN